MLRPLLRRIALKPDRRLFRAEQAFFDAYCRGGPHDRRDLVIPLGYFADPEVRRLLHTWLLTGRPLDLDGLSVAWRRIDPSGDERLFFKNLACFVALVSAPPPRPPGILRGDPDAFQPARP